MTALSIQPPYPIFTESDGSPLENGFVYIGTANLDPVANPIAVFWDAALTIPAAQPIRTLNGYPSRNGTPARLYVGSDYSIRVNDAKGVTVYSAPAATERLSNVVVTGADAAEVSYLAGSVGSQPRTLQSRLDDVFNVKDFGAVGDGITNDTIAIQAAINAAQQVKGWVYFPPVTFAYMVDGVTIGLAGTNQTCHFIGGGFDPSGASAPITGQFTGQSMLKLRDGNNNKNLVTVLPQAAPPQFWNMTFNGNKSAQTGTSHCIFMDDVVTPAYYRYACWIENCFVVSGRTSGLYIGANRGAGYYRHVWVQYCGTATSDIAVDVRCFDQQFTNLQVGPNTGRGMRLGSVTQIQMEGCVFFMNYLHLDVSQDAGSVHVLDTVFDESQIDAVTVARGIAPSGSSGARVFTNCAFRRTGQLATNTYSDIVIDSDRRITLDNCQFTGSEGTGKVAQHNIRFVSTSQIPYARVVNPISEDAAGNTFGTTFTNAYNSVMLIGTRDAYIGKVGGDQSISGVVLDFERWRTDSTGTAFLAKLFPPKDDGTRQINCAVYAGIGVPNNANGANGDFYFRSDTPGTANQRLYVRSGGTWVGIL